MIRRLQFLRKANRVIKKSILAMLACALLSSGAAKSQVYNQSASQGQSQTSEQSMYYAGLEAMRKSNFKDYTYVMNIDHNIFAVNDCVYVQRDGKLGTDLEKFRLSQRSGKHRASTQEHDKALSHTLGPSRLAGSIALSNVISNSLPKVSKMDYQSSVTYLVSAINSSWLTEYENAKKLIGTESIIFYFDNVSGPDAENFSCTDGPRDIFFASGGLGGLSGGNGGLTALTFQGPGGMENIASGAQAGYFTAVGNGLRAWHTNPIKGYVMGFQDNKFQIVKNNQTWFGPDSINGQRISIGTRNERGTNTTQKRGE